MFTCAPYNKRLSCTVHNKFKATPLYYRIQALNIQCTSIVNMLWILILFSPPHPPKKRLLEQEKVFILISSTVCIFIYILVCQAGRLLRICVFTHIYLGLIVLLSFPITLVLISTCTLPSPEFPLLALCLSDDPPTSICLPSWVYFWIHGISMHPLPDKCT